MCSCWSRLSKTTGVLQKKKNFWWDRVIKTWNNLRYICLTFISASPSMMDIIFAPADLSHTEGYIFSAVCSFQNYFISQWETSLLSLCNISTTPQPFFSTTITSQTYAIDSCIENLVRVLMQWGTVCRKSSQYNVFRNNLIFFRDYNHGKCFNFLQI